jgi:hypothetical protein
MKSNEQLIDGKYYTTGDFRVCCYYWKCRKSKEIG